jgi:hypothetical protein
MIARLAALQSFGGTPLQSGRGVMATGIAFASLDDAGLVDTGTCQIFDELTEEWSLASSFSAAFGLSGATQIGIEFSRTGNVPIHGASGRFIMFLSLKQTIGVPGSTFNLTPALYTPGLPVQSHARAHDNEVLPDPGPPSLLLSGQETGGPNDR